MWLFRYWKRFLLHEIARNMKIWIFYRKWIFLNGVSTFWKFSTIIFSSFISRNSSQLHSNIEPLYLLEISKCGILTGVCAVKRAENIWGCHLSLEEIICVRDNPFSLPCSIKISWMPWHFFKCNLLTFGHRMDWQKMATGRTGW